MHHDADKLHKKIDLSFDLKKKALERGFLISNNRGEGNCMFYALAEQLELKKGIRISHGNLRIQLVQYLHEHPKQVHCMYVHYYLSCFNVVGHFLILTLTSLLNKASHFHYQRVQWHTEL